MILPDIYIDKKVSKHSFYFAADSIYFENYGKVLTVSLQRYAAWASIHVHLYNPTNEQLDWCTKKQISYSYEYIDSDIRELKTYYACVRFIRVPEIFEDTCRIISLDCDSIAINDITQDAFLSATQDSQVLWREKQQTSLASSLFFSTDTFRKTYANKLKVYFENDSYRWFLDQIILDTMIENKEVLITLNKVWGSTKVRNTTLIWTLKGDRKFDETFQSLLRQYNLT
jgi:hypothetical protein